MSFSKRKRAKYGKKARGRLTKFKRGYRRVSKPKGFKKWQTKARWGGVDFPQMLQKKFSWVQTMNCNPSNTAGASVSDYKVVRLTSIYDPDYQVGGNSVNYFSNFLNTSLYSKYQVMGAKVTMDMVNPTTQMISVYNFLCDGANIASYAAVLLQQQLDDLARTPGGRDICYIGPATSGKNQKKISFYVKPWAVHGVTRAMYMAQPEYYGTYNNSPTNGLYLVIQAICTLENQGAELRNLLDVVFYTRLFDNVNATSMATGDGDADKPDMGRMVKSDGTEVTPEESKLLAEE